MTTWTNAQERPEYVVGGYVIGGYVEIAYTIADGSGAVWANATEANPNWPNAE